MKAYFEGDKDVFVFKPIPKAKKGRPKKGVPDTNVVKTNADHIRSLSDEELAEFLCGVYDDENCGVYQDECGKFICGTTILDYDQYKIADWLKHPFDGGNT